MDTRSREDASSSPQQRRQDLRLHSQTTRETSEELLQEIALLLAASALTLAEATLYQEKSQQLLAKAQ